MAIITATKYYSADSYFNGNVTLYKDLNITDLSVGLGGTSFTAKSVGSVGIGNSVPTSPFEVWGGGVLNPVSLLVDRSGRVAIGNSNPTRPFEVWAGSSTVASLSIDNSGRILTPNQPSANWRISCNISTFVRSLSIRRDAANNVTSSAAGNGTSHGSVGRFTAPVAGVYLITIRGTGSTISGSNELLTVYGSWSTAINVLSPGDEVLDLRVTPVLNDGVGWSCTLYLSANDYWELDWYRPASTTYVGTTIWDISTVLLG